MALEVVIGLGIPPQHDPLLDQVDAGGQGAPVSPVRKGAPVAVPDRRGQARQLLLDRGHGVDGAVDEEIFPSSTYFQPASRVSTSVVPAGRGSTLMIVTVREEYPALWSALASKGHTNGLNRRSGFLVRWPGDFLGRDDPEGPLAVELVCRGQEPQASGTGRRA